jgi:hypothetical protein
VRSIGRPRRLLRRPYTRLGIAGLAGHVVFELAAGVGMPLASLLGPAGAGALWTAATLGAWRAAGSDRPSADTPLAAVNAAGLAAIVAHLGAWPRRRNRLRVPWLHDCEGLGPRLMWLYNPILYVSGAGALLGLLRENRAAPAPMPLLVAGVAPVLAVSQRAEHRRMRRLARQRPGWWNRRLQHR